MADNYNEDDWNRASTALNKYVTDAGGGNIDWEKAQKTFGEQAGAGGNFGDWVNRTFDAKDSWTTPKGYQAPATPTAEWNRQVFRDTSMARPVGMTAADFINQNGYGGQVKLVPGSTDKVILPTGEVMDLSINANAQGQGTGNGWTGQGQWNGTSVTPYAAQGGGAANGGAVAAGQSAGPAGAAVTTPQGMDPVRQQLIDKLMQRSNQSLTVDRNDPTIRAQADAYSANEERSKRNYLADLAEKTGPLANLRGETRMANEQVGQRTGSFEADLMARQVAAQRAEIASSLEQMRGLLTSQQELALREKLAQMDDVLSRLKLDQNASQFGADLDYRHAALGQQGQIANNQLGYAYDTFDWEKSPLNPRNIIPAS